MAVARNLWRRRRRPRSVARLFRLDGRSMEPGHLQRRVAPSPWRRLRALWLRQHRSAHELWNGWAERNLRARRRRQHATFRGRAFLRRGPSWVLPSVGPIDSQSIRRCFDVFGASKSDPSSTEDGTEFGVKGALELWLTLSDDTWTSVDVSYSTARNESASRWRTGWRMAPKLSIGPELRYDKNIETGDNAWNGRAGLFARYEWAGGEASLAGGGLGRLTTGSSKIRPPTGPSMSFFNIDP